MISEKTRNLVRTTKWFSGTSRSMPLFVSDFTIRGYLLPSFVNGFCLKKALYIYYKDFHHSHRDEADIKELGKILKSKYTPERFLKEYEKEVRKEIDLFTRINSYESKLKKMDSKKFCEFLELCNIKAPQALTVLQYPVFISKLIEEKALNWDKTVFARMNKLRDEHAKIGWYFVNKIVPLILKRISRELGLTERQAGCFIPMEAIDSMRIKKSVVPIDELNERNKLAVLVQVGNKREVFSRTEAEELRQIFESGFASEKKLKGNPCYPGHTKGRVCKVEDYRELKKIKKGDILVTYMTTVHFTPYMRKIKGILTQEGGYSCHAVIISREFQIPCITGIKGLMNTIQDGDFVEVDAEKGIVRKLSS